MRCSQYKNKMFLRSLAFETVITNAMHSKITNDSQPSLKLHESFIAPVDTPEISAKTKLQTSEPMNEFINKLVEKEEAVLPTNDRITLTDFHQNAIIDRIFTLMLVCRKKMHVNGKIFLNVASFTINKPQCFYNRRRLK